MAKLDTTGLLIYKDNDFKPFEIDETKRYVMCGVPGAFTPGCTEKHLPGYVQALNQFYEKGIDHIIFMGVNDPCVMDAWNKFHGHKDIIAVADAEAEFTKRMGFDHDYGPGMGIRCRRFAILIENGEMKKEMHIPFAQGALGEIY